MMHWPGMTLSDLFLIGHEQRSLLLLYQVQKMTDTTGYTIEIL
jgi:hypothetical protein